MFKKWRERREARRRLLVIGALYMKSQQSAYQLGETTGLWGGGLYPTLHAMEREKIIYSIWEGTFHPRSRLYSLAAAVFPGTPI